MSDTEGSVSIKKDIPPVSPTLMWIVTSAFFFYALIARASFVTVLAHDFMQFFQIDAVGLGTLTSCYYWVYTFMQIPSGIMIDRYSNKTIVAVMSGTVAIGLILLATVPNCYVAGFAEMLIGFGSSFSFLIVLKMITTWFPQQKVAVMTSYTMTLGACGPFVGGPLVSFLADHVNWHTVMVVYAGLGVLIGILICFVTNTPKKESEETKNVKEKAMGSLLSDLRAVLSSKNLWILGFLTLALYAPVSSLGDLWGVSFAQNVFHVSRTKAAIISNMLYVGYTVGCPLSPHFANYINSYKKTMNYAIICLTLCLVLLVLPYEWPLPFAYILFFLVGFFSGAQLTYALGFLEMPARIGGTVSSFINMMSMISGIILMPLVGWAIDSSWNGAMENGVKIYTAADFKYGVSYVVLFVFVGAIISFFVKDHAPSEARK